MLEQSQLIIEAGHYYKALGPTLLSIAGWTIGNYIKNEGDHMMLFVDDMHGIDDVHPDELYTPVIDLWQPSPCPDLEKINESDMKTYALEVLDVLANIPGKKRAKYNPKNDKWFLSDFALAHGNGADCEPICVLLDAGLTLWKARSGYTGAVNVLPYYYEKEQKNLLKILERLKSTDVFPELKDFNLEVVLFNDENTYWNLK